MAASRGAVLPTTRPAKITPGTRVRQARKPSHTTADCAVWCAATWRTASDGVVRGRVREDEPERRDRRRADREDDRSEHAARSAQVRTRADRLLRHGAHAVTIRRPRDPTTSATPATVSRTRAAARPRMAGGTSEMKNAGTAVSAESRRKAASGSTARVMPRQARTTQTRLATPSAAPDQRDRHGRVVAIGHQRAGDVDEGQQRQDHQPGAIGARHEYLRNGRARHVRADPTISPRPLPRAGCCDHVTGGKIPVSSGT